MKLISRLSSSTGGTLDLSSRTLSHKASLALSKALADSGAGGGPSALDLSDSNLSNDSLSALFNGLRTNATVESLNLKGIGLQGRLLAQLGDVVRANNAMLR